MTDTVPTGAGSTATGPGAGLSTVAVEAMRLQNGYALAIDARDWELFRTVFTPDVQADYPHGVFDGM